MNVIFFTYRIFIDIIMSWPCATFVNVNTCFAHNTFAIIKLSTWIDKSLLLHSLCSVPIATYCGWFLRLNVIFFLFIDSKVLIRSQCDLYSKTSIHLYDTSWVVSFAYMWADEYCRHKDWKKRIKFWSLSYLTEFHYT